MRATGARAADLDLPFAQRRMERLPQCGSVGAICNSAPGFRFASSGLRHDTGFSPRSSSITAIFFDAVRVTGVAKTVPPRSEASSGDIQRAEPGAAPAGGRANRTRATTGHYDPDAVGAAAVERRKASAPIAHAVFFSACRPRALRRARRRKTIRQSTRLSPPYDSQARISLALHPGYSAARVANSAYSVVVLPLSVSVKARSPSFSIEVTILSPALSHTCLSLG